MKWTATAAAGLLSFRQEPRGVLRQDQDDGNGLGSAADYETRGIALFHSINDNLTLVAELNQFEIEGRDTAALDEETRTFAVGAALSSKPNTGRGWQPNRRSRHPLRCSGAYVDRPHALNTVLSAVPQSRLPQGAGLFYQRRRRRFRTLDTACVVSSRCYLGRPFPVLK